MPEPKLPVTIRLGSVDEDAFQQTFQQTDDRIEYFQKYHQRFWYRHNFSKKQKLQFRGEANGKWIAPSPPSARAGRSAVSGDEVKTLQRFLSDAGFMPNATIDGIFGYWTQASFRLFQEYVRTIEKDESIGFPDGVVGKKGWTAVNRWPKGKVCEWGRAYENMRKAKKSQPEEDQPLDPESLDFASDEFKQWLQLMPKVRDYYKEQLAKASAEQINQNLELFQLNLVEHYDKKCDTKPIAEWTFRAQDPHLLGIRCNHERGILNRENDDLFVLLLNGMVFKFWGSTDPNPRLAHKSREKGDEPFLVEGHHKYQFGWHKLNPTQVYGGLHPYSNGVMVFRDRDNDNALTEKDIRAGLDDQPNTTINIHWSGIGDYNYSAGCQVISGQSYINHKDSDNYDGLVDCSEFASRGYDGLGRQTRGAYNVLSDLVFVYSPPGVDYIYYTLGRDGTLDLISPELGSAFAHRLVGRMKKEAHTH